MATKQKQAAARPVNVAPEVYQHMVDVMRELAYRNKQAEDLMMRVANAGGISEVSEEIKKRRMYAKKMGWTRGGSRAPVGDGAQPEPRKLRKPGGNRRRGDRVAERPPSRATPGSSSTASDQEIVA